MVQLASFPFFYHIFLFFLPLPKEEYVGQLALTNRALVVIDYVLTLYALSFIAELDESQLGITILEQHSPLVYRMMTNVKRLGVKTSSNGSDQYVYSSSSSNCCFVLCLSFRPCRLSSSVYARLLRHSVLVLLGSDFLLSLVSLRYTSLVCSFHI
jgi:hypothetical protein